MLSMLHMTGDADLIRGELRPAGLFLNEVQGFMSEEDKGRGSAPGTRGDQGPLRPGLSGT